MADDPLPPSGVVCYHAVARIDLALRQEQLFLSRRAMEDKRLLADWGMRGDDCQLAVETSDDSSEKGSAGWKAWSIMIPVAAAVVIVLAIVHGEATRTRTTANDLAASILKRSAHSPVVATKLVTGCLPPACSRLDRCPKGEFLYFGYGSNLCEERLKLANPSARYIATAALHDYRLIFSRKSKTWSGGAADVIRSPGHTVWGVVWAMCNGHSETLDRQEGVKLQDAVNVGGYKRLTLDVQDAEGHAYKVRSYEVVDKMEGLLPSPGYKAAILCGAVEFLPDPYVAKLKTLPHNGYQGEYPDRQGTNLGKWLPYLHA